jgi:putative DNA primase/helicase
MVKISDHYKITDPRGWWPTLLARFGVPDECMGKNRPCPFCGGDDRFSFTDLDGKGTFFCRQCGRKGNGYTFVMEWQRVEFGEASNLVQVSLKNLQKEGLKPQPVHAGSARPHGSRSIQEKIDYRERIWERADDITAHDPVGRYLVGRIGFLPRSPELRHLPEKNTGTSWMVGRFVGDGGYTLHFTNMNPKAEPRRKLADGPRPAGGAVRLAPVSDGVLGIAEGIETAYSASTIFGINVWSALDKHGLETWRPPADVVAVMIFADNDADGGGLAAARALQARLPVRSEIHMPDPIPGVKGTDWNDVWQQQRSKQL